MQTKPNIILVMADQLTAFALSQYGNSVTKTPNINAFASEATLFSQAYCNYPLCAPSRFSLMSGRLPSRIAAYDNGAEFPASVPTLAHYLRDAGYYTCLSGKMHFVGPDQHHGYESRLTTEIYPSDFSWTPPETYDTFTDPEQGTSEGPAPGVSSVETITDAGAKVRSMQMDYDDEVIHRACQHLFDWSRQGDDRPLFMTVSFTQPHDPYVSRREFWDLYTDEEIDPPRVPPIALEDMDAHSRSLYFHYSLDKFNVTTDIYRRARHGYYAMISDIDAKFGRLRQTLRECGMDQNTVVMFTSDHGDMVGERGLWFKKNLFDPAIRVPMMLSWPGMQLPASVDTPVSLLDVLPTLTDIAGVGRESLVGQVEGESLLAIAKKRESVAAGSRVVCAEHLDGGTCGPRVMLRKGSMKIVHSLDYPTQLYDLSTDPHELDNLAEREEYKTDLADMRSAVEQHWDLPAIRQDIISNQRIRQLLSRSLAKGRIETWEHYPDPHQHSSRWVRRGDAFPEIEKSGYIDYPTE